MAKKLKLAVVSVAVVALAAAGVFWYVAAGNAVSYLGQQIEAFNTKVRPDGSSAKIGYAKLERTMFPAVGARITNPTLDLSVPGDGAAVAPVTLSWKATGTTDLITNYLTHSYSLRTNGSSHVEIQAGDQHLAADSEQNQTAMSIAAKDAASFKAWQTLDPKNPQAVRAALEDVAKFSFDFGPLKVKDATSGAVVLAQDKGMIRLANRTTDARLNVDFKADVRGVEITKEYNAIINRMLHATNPQMEAMDLDSIPFSSVRAGAQDIAIDLSVNAPPPGGNAPMKDGLLDIRTLSIKNNFYTISMPLKIVLSEKNKERIAQVTADWALDVKPAAAAEMAQAVEMGSTRIPFLPGVFQKGSESANPDEVKKRMQAALPTLSTLGPITLKVDVEAKVPTPPESGHIADENAPETLSIHNVAFNHARWGFGAKGDMIRKRKDGTTVTMNIDCNHCETMTGDMYVTATDVQALMNLLQPGRDQWNLTDAMLANVNQILADVGKKGANGDIAFAITSPRPNEIQLGGKPIGEFMTRLMLALNPPPEAAAPAAGAPDGAALPQGTSIRGE